MLYHRDGRSDHGSRPCLHDRTVCIGRAGVDKKNQSWISEETEAEATVRWDKFSLPLMRQCRAARHSGELLDLQSECFSQRHVTAKNHQLINHFISPLIVTTKVRYHTWCFQSLQSTEHAPMNRYQYLAADFNLSKINVASS